MDSHVSTMTSFLDTALDFPRDGDIPFHECLFYDMFFDIFDTVISTVTLVLSLLSVHMFELHSS